MREAQFMAKPIHVRRTIHDGAAVNSCIEDAMALIRKS